MLSVKKPERLHSLKKPTRNSQMPSSRIRRSASATPHPTACLSMCGTDTDCAMGQLCVCHGSPYSGVQGNTCIKGNCRVDGDCGAGGFCSPSHGTSGCGGVVGYYCHTAMDTCTDDSDCKGGFEVCAFSDADARWKCQPQLLCP